MANAPAGRACAVSARVSAASALARTSGSALGTTTPRRPGAATAATSCSTVSAFTRTQVWGVAGAEPRETTNSPACLRAVSLLPAATASSRSRMSASAALPRDLASLSLWSAGTYR